MLQGWVSRSINNDFSNVGYFYLFFIGNMWFDRNISGVGDRRSRCHTISEAFLSNFVTDGIMPRCETTLAGAKEISKTSSIATIKVFLFDIHTAFFYNFNQCLYKVKLVFSFSGIAKNCNHGVLISCLFTTEDWIENRLKEDSKNVLLFIHLCVKSELSNYHYNIFQRNSQYYH